MERGGRGSATDRGKRGGRGRGAEAPHSDERAHWNPSSSSINSLTKTGINSTCCNRNHDAPAGRQPEIRPRPCLCPRDAAVVNELMHVGSLLAPQWLSTYDFYKNFSEENEESKPSSLRERRESHACTAQSLPVPTFRRRRQRMRVCMTDTRSLLAPQANRLPPRLPPKPVALTSLPCVCLSTCRGSGDVAPSPQRATCNENCPLM